MEKQLPPIWVIKCTEYPKDGSDGWHWRHYFSDPEAYSPDEPAMDWGGEDWIRSTYSMKLLREDVLAGHLAVCYQSDDAEYGRCILGVTQFHSDGKEDYPGSERYNCFDLIPPEDAFFLDPPLTICDLYETGCHPKCFGRGTQGTIFPVEARDFEGILRATARQSAAQKKALQKWLQRVSRK